MSSLDKVTQLVSRKSEGVSVIYGVCKRMNADGTCNVIIDGDTEETQGVYTTQKPKAGSRVIMIESKRLLTVIGQIGGGFNVDDVFPVGAIYINASGTDPSTIFQGTKWQRIGSGRTLIDAGGSYSLQSTGGSSSVSLTTRELPSHSHSVSCGYAGSHSHSLGVDYDGRGGGRAATVHKAGYYGAETSVQTANEGSHSHSISISSAGSGSSFSIQNPYFAVAIWRRTS